MATTITTLCMYGHCQAWLFIVRLQVVLTKLSKSLDKDSVRVDGTGRASITEVSFQEISITGLSIVSLVSCVLVLLSTGKTLDC